MVVDRKCLKRNAKYHLKRNYWVIVFVALVMLVFANSYKDIGEDYSFVYNNNPYSNYIDSNYEVTGNILESIFGENKVEKLPNLDNIGSEFKPNKIEEVTNTDNVTDGIFKVIFNIFAKFEKTLFRLINSILNIFDPAKAGIIIGVTIYLFQLLYKIFVVEPLIIGEGRFFLESRLYSKTKFNRIFYSFKKKKYMKAVKAGLRKSIYLFLWSFTIIGAVIKSYSYRMVSYLMAEKPELTSKEAILLSRQMMYGHKWQTFILDLSFIGWRILDLFTFGFLGVMYVNPYYRATDIELFTALKSENESVKWDDNLISNDDCLLAYPGIKARKKIDASKKFNYYKRYSLTSFILFFFSFSLVGFLWEVIFHFIQFGEFMKKGTLIGPWLPIYGFGCIIVLLLLIPKKFKKLTDNPMVTFLIIMFICTVMEYATSVFLEVTKGLKWWDYTGFFMNINGRVCLEGSIFFGLGGCACIYLLAPFLDQLFSKIPRKVRNVICVVLVIIFAADFIHAQVVPNTNAAAPVTIMLNRRL